MPDHVAEVTGVSLGFGAFADVLEVRYKGKRYAAKVYRNLESETLMSTLLQERQILSLVQHKNVIPYYGTCLLKDAIATAIIMQWMEMNLQVALENRSLVFKQRMSVLGDVARGLAYLHSLEPPIVHRDLNATNILLDSNKTAKITDFGASAPIDSEESPCPWTPFPGTTEYMPPEAVDGDYDEKLDVFSFGHLSIYTLSQQQPSPLLQYTYSEGGKLLGRSEVDRRGKYLESVREILELEGKRSQLYSIVVCCLHNDSGLRPSSRDIVESGVLLTI